MRRLILLVFLCLLVGVSPIWAHANLLRSDPAPSATLDSAPQAISLWFTEALEPDFSRILLLDGKGGTVITPASVVDPADAKHMTLMPGSLPDGVYTVSWRSISAADGHSTSGSYAFAVGQVTDRGHRLGVHAGVHEPGEVAPADYAEGRVAGVDQLPSDLHPVLQHRVEAVGPGHRQERAQQSPQPPLRALHIAHPLQQLLE